MEHKQADQRLSSLLQSWVTPFCLSMAALLLAYAIASWAIDSGRLLAYALTMVLLVLAVRYAAQTIRRIRQK